MLDLKKRMEDVMKTAARAFLRAAIPHVPVVTGHARGMLKPLGRFLRVSVPTPGAKPDTSRKRSIAIGENEGDKGPFIKITGNKINFAYSIKTLHYRINETRADSGVGPSGFPYPWESIKGYGREAFITTLQEQYRKRLPRIRKYTRRSRFK